MSLLARDEQTIIAQCTPSGSGAIAILRISGSDAIEITQKIALLASKKDLTSVPTHTIHFGFVINEAGNHIDQVLFLVMRAPKSFTGQNTVEISCHNNPFIIEAIIERAVAAGARPAQHGEFTKRAYLNKKIDLVQAEAINDIIHAHTQQALKKSLAQLEGSFSFWINDIEQRLIKTHSLCAASFEFIEEDINFDNQIRSLLEETITKITTIRSQYAYQAPVKEGVRIAIIGMVNAGKSSLFNALIKKNRAIVTPIPGTTRDTIEAGIYKSGLYLTIVDTAGIRSTGDAIEQEGINRSLQEAEIADIVLLSFDPSSELEKQEHTWYQNFLAKHRPKTVLVATKHDLPGKQESSLPPHLSVSSKTGQHIDILEELILQKAQRLVDACACPFLVNKRQAHTLAQLENDLNAVLPMLHENPAYELICVHLKDALEKTTELTGKTIDELSVDNIFKDFCIGK